MTNKPILVGPQDVDPNQGAVIAGHDARRPDDPQLGILFDIQKKYNDAGGRGVFGSLHGDPRALATAWDCDLGCIVSNPRAPGGAFAVYGSIYQRYKALGGPRSYLGQPTSDEHDFDGGRASSFEHGEIYWWPDTGAAIDLGAVKLSYTGLYCQDETDPELGNSDDPYLVVTWLANTTGAHAKGGMTTQVYSDVGDGSSRPDLVDFYVGPPHGISFNVSIFEHDLGDPRRDESTIKAVLEANHEIGKFALGYIPLVGGMLQATLAPALEKLIPEWTEALIKLFGTGDDLVGRRTINLSPRDMVLKAARATNQEWQGIGYKLETGNVDGSGGTYNAYFGIVPV